MTIDTVRAFLSSHTVARRQIITGLTGSFYYIPGSGNDYA
jgi:hypothetical protein